MSWFEHFIKNQQTECTERQKNSFSKENVKNSDLH